MPCVLLFIITFKLANDNHLSNIDQVWILDAGIELHNRIDRRAIFAGNDAESFTSLHDVRRDLPRDRDGLANIDQVRVVDLRIQSKNRIDGGVELCRDLLRFSQKLLAFSPGCEMLARFMDLS